VHEVDVEAGLPVLLGVGNGERADVRHHHVEAAERFGRLLHPRRQRRPVADIDGGADHGAAPAECLLRGRDLFRVAGAEGDVGPLVEEALDDRPADATGAAGDQDV
jgi:hypothetical protein